MTEARYKGQKTVVVSPDYSDHTKFADDWLPAQPGTDAALAMAMSHVIFKEFYVDRQVFEQYARQFTDLPFLVRLKARGEGFVADRFLHANDLSSPAAKGENAEWKTVVYDNATQSLAVPNGSIGDRWGKEGAGKWNLDLDGIEPALSLLNKHKRLVALELPLFDGPEASTMHRGVPVIEVDGQLVTTVFDLLAAQLGIRRCDEMPGEWPQDYDDPAPHTPAWQEPITGVDAKLVRKSRVSSRATPSAPTVVR